MKKNNTKILLEKITLLNQKQNFYHNNEKTLVGFSGGADSVTLLHALYTLLGKDRLVALHINHMLRGEEADGDEEFCRDFCQTREIPFLSRKINVKTICGDHGFEEAARNVRYQAFEEAAEAMQCTTISLAHTASDNLETMLFNLCRGAGASGLSGIPVQRPLGKYTVVRPLLDVTREEILAYAEENELPFRTDSTNTDTAYTRNFIRAEIIPLMKKINLAAEENARYASAAVTDLQNYAEKDAEAFLQSHGQNDEIPVSDLQKLSSAVRYLVLEALCKRAGGEMLSRAQALALEDIVSQKKTGASLSLSGNLIARLDGENLRFFHNDVENDSETVWKKALSVGKNQLGKNAFLYIGEKLDGDFRFCTAVRIAENSLSTLHARPRENGESYRFGGMTRKLKKLLCGRSLAEKSRPVICDADGVIWLPGFPVADGKEGELPIYYVER